MGERPHPAVFYARYSYPLFVLAVCFLLVDVLMVASAGTLRGFRLLRRHNRGIACGGHPRKGHEAPRKEYEAL